MGSEMCIRDRSPPVGHGYVFSMAVGTIGEWLKVVLFLLGDEQLILRGGGGGCQFFTINIEAVKHSGLGP